MLQVTNTITGEVHELMVTTPYQQEEAWVKLQKFENQIKAARKKLRTKVLETMGNDDEMNLGKRTFKRTIKHYSDYDLSVMRDYLDEDTINVLVKPDNRAVDSYLDDHKDELGDDYNVLKSAKVVTRTAEELRLV